MGVWKFAFELAGRWVVTLLPLSVVDGGSGVLKITSCLPLPPPLARSLATPPLSYLELEQSYLYPVGG